MTHSLKTTASDSRFFDGHVWCSDLPECKMGLCMKADSREAAAAMYVSGRRRGRNGKKITVWTMVSSPEFATGKIREEFEFWRPSQHSRAKYRTQWQTHLVPRKIIKSVVRSTYNGMFEESYHFRGHVESLDWVFHALDGKGIPEGHYGPLVTAIRQTSTQSPCGQTDYFKFRCYGNGNLHLEFLRGDLLADFNRIGSGSGEFLPDKNPAA